ncbi:MAG: glutathione S-transferase family protein [Pleurocapsa sp. MO_192.B19]|nr:glutathione S-transferase family protein [Pleurocapsa sp. MO_192.B19]
MNTLNKEKPLLITIAISHYCEKVRWALDYLDIDYLEENHALPFHRQYTSRYGGTSVPVLVIGDRVFTDSKDILHYLNTISSDKQLYPQDAELRNQVETLEELFDRKLGVATRCWAYYYAIKKPLKIALAWGKGASIIEKIKIALAFSKIPDLLSKNYNVTPEGKDAALQDIREVFTVVNQKLNSGQKYLVGDCLTAADLTFAALASPVLRPKNHPLYDSQLSKLPTERLVVIEELRATPAGKLVSRLYREQR